MRRQFRRKTYICRIGILALAILAGHAAQPMSERAAIAQSLLPEMPRICLI